MWGFLPTVMDKSTSSFSGVYLFFVRTIANESGGTTVLQNESDSMEVWYLPRRVVAVHWRSYT